VDQWSYYALFLTYVGLFRNSTLNFTSNLGHEGLIIKHKGEYAKLYSLVGVVVVGLQLTSLPVILIYFKEPVVLMACVYSVIMSIQSLIQNFFRYSFNYGDYGKSSYIFSMIPLLSLCFLWFYNIEFYLWALVMSNAMIIFFYKDLVLEIIRAFSIDYLKQNLWRMTKSSFRLFAIRFPDSYFFIYFILIEKVMLSDEDIAILVYLISLSSIDKFPLLTTRVQENMDSIKSNGALIQEASTISIWKQLKFILPLIFGYLIIELFYISYVAEGMQEILNYFPLICGYLLMIIWRYNANAIIELKDDIWFKLIPFGIAGILHLVMYYENIGSSLSRFFVSGMVYLFIFYFKFLTSFREFGVRSLGYIAMNVILISFGSLIHYLTNSVVVIMSYYLLLCLSIIYMNKKSYLKYLGA